MLVLAEPCSPVKRTLPPSLEPCILLGVNWKKESAPDTGIKEKVCPDAADVGYEEVPVGRGTGGGRCSVPVVPPS